MKKLTSKPIIALCIVVTGVIAFVLLNPQVGADPVYYIVKHTNVDCYEQDGEWMAFCRSFTVTTVFPVQPWSGHENDAVHARLCLHFVSGYEYCCEIDESEVPNT